MYFQQQLTRFRRSRGPTATAELLANCYRATVSLCTKVYAPKGPWKFFLHRPCFARVSRSRIHSWSRSPVTSAATIKSYLLKIASWMSFFRAAGRLVLMTQSDSLDQWPWPQFRLCRFAHYGVDTPRKQNKHTIIRPIKRRILLPTCITEDGDSIKVKSTCFF